MKFISAKELGGHRWRSVFKALDTNDSDVLIGHTFEFSVKNEKVKRRGGGEHITFCNIKSVSLVKQINNFQFSGERRSALNWSRSPFFQEE